MSSSIPQRNWPHDLRRIRLIVSIQLATHNLPNGSTARYPGPFSLAPAAAQPSPTSHQITMVVSTSNIQPPLITNLTGLISTSLTARTSNHRVRILCHCRLYTGNPDEDLDCKGQPRIGRGDRSEGPWTIGKSFATIVNLPLVVLTVRVQAPQR